MADQTKAELVRLADRLRLDNCRLRNQLRNTHTCPVCRVVAWLRQRRVMA